MVNGQILFSIKNNDH